MGYSAKVNVQGNFLFFPIDTSVQQIPIKILSKIKVSQDPQNLDFLWKQILHKPNILDIYPI